jgi:hypothetical protein
MAPSCTFVSESLGAPSQQGAAEGGSLAPHAIDKLLHQRPRIHGHLPQPVPPACPDQPFRVMTIEPNHAFTLNPVIGVWGATERKRRLNL